MSAELFADLFGLMPRGFTLPPVEFFKPKQKFVDWMCAEWKGEAVYDIGAGCGQVARALYQAGINDILAIDHHNRTGAKFPVAIVEATSYPYAAGSTALLCRPCHGPFAECVIKRAIDRRVARIIYVGFGKNLKDDLGDFKPSFKKVMDRAGEQGESVWNLVLSNPIVN